MFFIPASDYAFTEERLPRDSHGKQYHIQGFQEFSF